MNRHLRQRRGQKSLLKSAARCAMFVSALEHLLFETESKAISFQPSAFS
jgi:hypothetical protein